MKNFLKLLSIFVLVALLLTACGTDKTTVYTATYVTGGNVQFIFNGDGTFIQRLVFTFGNTVSIFEWYKGTYTGDPKKDGNITLNVTYEYDDDSSTYVAITTRTVTLTVSRGQFTYNGFTYSRN